MGATSRSFRVPLGGLAGPGRGRICTRDENWLGVALAALMKIPKDRVAWLGAEALRRIQASAPLSDQERFLLGECVAAYLPLDDASKREFERLLAAESCQGVQAMNKTSYEKGIEHEGGENSCVNCWRSNSGRSAPRC